jgi:hypothetical protein
LRCRSCLILLATFGLSISCWPVLASTIEEQRPTPSGPLVIEQVDEGPLGNEFYVQLATKTILHSKLGDVTTEFPAFPIPHLFKYFGEPISGFDAVAVFQQFNWGNACDGGPVWFLGISRDGNFKKSNSVEFCGPPETTVKHGIIHLIRSQPGQALPPKEWIYSGGKLQKVTTTR